MPSRWPASEDQDMNKMKSNALSVAVAMALLSGAAMAQTTPATKTRVYLQTRGETQSAASGGEADMQASLQSNRRVDVLSCLLYTSRCV